MEKEKRKQKLDPLDRSEVMRQNDYTLTVCVYIYTEEKKKESQIQINKFEQYS